MASKRTFKRHTITWVVLTEGQDVDGMSIESIAFEAEAGGFVGDWSVETEVLDGAAMAKALDAARSEPGFFQLTEDGEDQE